MKERLPTPVDINTEIKGIKLTFREEFGKGFLIIPSGLPTFVGSGLKEVIWCGNNQKDAELLFEKIQKLIHKSEKSDKLDIWRDASAAAEKFLGM